MSILLAALLAQVVQLPAPILEAYSRFHPAFGIEHVTERDLKAPVAGTFTLPAFNGNFVMPTGRQTWQTTYGSNDVVEITDDRMQPYWGSSDVPDDELGAKTAGILDTDVDDAALKVLHGTDGASSLAGGKRGNDKTHSAEQHANVGDQHRRNAAPYRMQRDQVAPMDGTDGLPLGAEIGLLAIGWLYACAMIFLGAYVFATETWPFPSRKANSWYGGIIATMGVLTLLKPVYGPLFMDVW